jgi:site-specific DNA recombinase
MKKPAKVVRCGIYTRKSTEEGLEQEFNSLDAQRVAAEAYIASQQHEGWRSLPEHYDDGGYTGANMDRPALRQLLADIAAKKIDMVLVYKIDRLSRSLLDFTRIVEIFDEHQVSFASITQQFNTATSMGRLMLNILLSFAQFEREIIGERTRDKIAAARRKGKWIGGQPLLGYDVDPATHKLVVNDKEADRVRFIFELYQKEQALQPVLRELQRRGWRTKQWQTRKGQWLGGQPFTRTNLRRLLRNPTYIGQVRYKDERHPGEHPAIIHEALWQAVQPSLQEKRRPANRSLPPALLKGLLYCRPCNCPMRTIYNRYGSRRYCYYLCATALKNGWKSCPTKSVPAGEIERVVLEQIEKLGEQEPLLAQFASAWPGLGAEEQFRLLRQVVERVDYDGSQSKLAINFRPDAAEGLLAALGAVIEEVSV